MDPIYESYVDGLVESINRPYKYSWNKLAEEHSQAVFNTDDGRLFVIVISLDRAGECEIQFAQSTRDDSKMGKTGEGDPFRVFATVIAAVSEYFEKFGDNINVLKFDAEKSTNPKDTRANSREQLYKRMVNKYSPPGNWKRDIINQGWRTIFKFTRIA